MSCRDVVGYCEDDGIDTIADVVARLELIRDTAVAESPLGERDGIACFTRLYHVITANVMTTVDRSGFADGDFLTRLDVEFAKRYFAAVRAYDRDPRSAPRAWQVLFDNRHDAGVGPVHFAAAGVNAHVNYDLAFALLETWKDFPPNDARLADYRMINDIFATEMDLLREYFGSLLSRGADDAWYDRAANWAGETAVTITRDWAWDAAREVYRSPDGERARERKRCDERLDATARWVGTLLVRAPFLPV
ncbi:MAG: DUF5995 family protein [Pseudonocardia sp.]|nr:DUF5995 family protein [Pseudonocardia sp.]